MEEPYEEQLRIKEQRVRRLLRSCCPTAAIHGMEHPYHYRNKVHAVFAAKNGKLITGVYARGSHQVIPSDGCLLENERASQIVRRIRELAEEFRLEAFNEDSGRGLLRHVLIRTADATGQILVTIGIGQKTFPAQNAFVGKLVSACPDITGVNINLNREHTSMILGPYTRTVYGRGYIIDEMCGKRFALSAESFYQVNPVQTRFLYEKAICLAQLTGKETILDAYCGIGTIGLIAADHARQAIGVEINARAVEDARHNAQRNAAANIRFVCADCGTWLRSEEGRTVKPDAVFVDPPRSGCDMRFLSALVRNGPDRIVYISCMPETLARDIGYLTQNGYRAEYAYPFDMFPFTEHVETVVLMSRKDT